MGELDGKLNKQRGEVDGSGCRIQSTLNAGDDTKSQRGDSFNLNSLPCVAAYRKDDSFEDPVVGSKEDSLELTGNEKSSKVDAKNVVRSEEYTDISVLGNKDGSSKVFGDEERSDCAAVVKKDEPIKISEDRECTNGDGVARKDDSAKVSVNEEKGGIAIVKKDDSLEPTSCSVAATANCENNSGKKIGGIAGRISAVKSPIPRSSNYHGVTRHRWSGKYEAHLWDNSCRVEGRRRKGKQVYLGSYDTEEKAARAYDLAALKYWGASTKLNFPVSEYEKELEDVKDMTREECVAYLRRRSSCFSRGASIYRGVTRIVVVRGFPAISPLYFFNFFIGYPSTKTYIDDRRQKDGRWQARIGLVADTRDIYLGTFKTEEEAAEAYDIAAVELRGRNAVTNFDISNYIDKGPRRVEEAGVQQL